DMRGARSIFAKQSLPCESKNAFLAPFPPGSPEGTRGKGVLSIKWSIHLIEGIVQQPLSGKPD
ncbi:MAG: hypothetical protein II879_10050, partial [Clostridia bacterium]|nr:hypothetical protein [Clostridia bacterium]